jgi:hypothetical protein
MSGATLPRRSRRMVPGAVLLLAAVLAAACSNKGVTADPAVAPFVGDWAADSLVLTSEADPQIAPDLIALGATFTLNVQPSGQYTAILLYSGQSQTEIGKVEVSGQTVTLRRTYPSASITAGTYSFNGDHLVIDGETQFDFNLDGTLEPALLLLDLVKK